MEFKKIYFDMDGVLADFDRGVIEILNLKPVKQEYHTVESDNLLFGEMKKAEHFYLRLHALEGSLELFNEIYEKYGGDVVEILTGIPNPKRGIDSAKEDKIRWVRKELPEGVKVNALLRKDKPKYCLGKEYVLIDDFTKNIQEWESEGGTGILFTAPQQVREKLEELAAS